MRAKRDEREAALVAASFVLDRTALPRVVARELLDDVRPGDADLAGSLRDIALANRFFGGIVPVRREIARLAPRRVLDVGCGGMDVSRALIADARRRGRPLHVTGLDASDEILANARAGFGPEDDVAFACARGESLPFADGAFDVAICTLALHHFEPPAAIALLRELRRVSARTPLVCDLRRSAIGLAGAFLFSRLVSRNRLTRNDAPLSVRRAYTPRETERLARLAGWRRPRARIAAALRLIVHDAG